MLKYRQDTALCYCHYSQAQHILQTEFDTCHTWLSHAQLPLFITSCHWNVSLKISYSCSLCFHCYGPQADSVYKFQCLCYNCYDLADDNCQSSRDCYAKPQCCGQIVLQHNQSSVKVRPSAEQHHNAKRVTVAALILLHIFISTMTDTARSARYQSHCTAAGAPPTLLV